MIDLKPSLDSYARVSYFRELHGDLAGAREALALALGAGGEASENVAYIQTLQGNLELSRGRRGAARQAYRAALVRAPRYVPARVGLARTDAAAGRLGQAIGRLRSVVARLPLPEYVVLLGETELAAGRRSAAPATLTSCACSSGCCRARESTPTSSWRSSKPTTATPSAASRWPARRGTARRAYARPMRWAGR